MVIGVLAAVAEADGQRRGRGGRRQGRRQRPRGGRQQDLNGGLGPPPQPVIDLPAAAAAPLPIPSGPANRFIPTGGRGPQPGSALPAESLVTGHIPDRDGNYDFE